LSPGSEFRNYCDRYAQFIKENQQYGILFVNVDVISNPELTWKVQRYFEEEHGVTPVPVVHYGTPMRYVDRYLEAGKYDLLGVGGLGQGVARDEYFGWADEFFCHICPESNHYLPVIKTHGFAMTSWELMCRYPWYSVDSATWVKLAAYGWVYIPTSEEDSVFRYDEPPIVLNFSEKSSEIKYRGRHYLNSSPVVKKMAVRWLDHLGLTVEQVSTHYRHRSIANLHYLKDLEESRPPWPHPLDYKVVDRHSVRYRKGFGL
jgi:hypothetical protein